MALKSLCIATEGYPYDNDPQFSFVEVLCKALAKQGIRIIVVSPQSLIHVLLKKDKKHPLYREYSDEGSAAISVYRPWFLLLPYRFRKLNDLFFKKAVERVIKNNNINTDAYYGHFWNNAYYISGVANSKKKPLFVASGEGNFDDLQSLYTSPAYKAFSKKVAGVICVSSSCRDYSVRFGMTTEDKCVVIPNAIDHKLFHLKDKKSLRKHYGFPEDKFIVAFTGSFIRRKGPDRLSNALELLDDNDVYSFFIGAGQGPENLVPTCSRVLFYGKVPHDKIVDYLNMADVFVLPTLNEGCCNAIIEAMACGLPVISSDMPFNHDLLNKDNSILVDPLNVSEITNAIKLLKENETLRRSLGQGAIKTASRQEINVRAKAIIDFINERILFKA